MLFLNDIIPCKTDGIFLPNEDKIKSNTLFYNYSGVSFYQRYERFLMKNLRISGNHALSKDDINVSIFLAQKLDLLKTENYSIIKGENNKYHSLVLANDKKDKFEEGINHFIELDNLYDKYFYCHTLIDENTVFMPVQNKNLIQFNESEISYEESSVYNPVEEQSLFKITSDIILDIDVDLLTMNKFIESDTSLLKDKDLEILQPLIHHLDLNKSENYIPVIINDNEGEQIEGFKLDKEKQAIIYNISNQVVLVSGLDDKYKIVSDFISSTNKKNKLKM